ncbi:MAG: ArsC family reductase [Cellvibrionaceae bacterium]
MITLYGIKNCDTVKKARTWLDKNKVDYTFHDFRADGLNAQQVKQWVADLGWETLVNKRSTTWKTLGESVKTTLNDETVVDVILEAPTLIKRPLLDKDATRIVGFKEPEYKQLFK